MVSAVSYPKDFWLLWSSSIVSGIGDGVRVVALPLLATTVTRDPLLIALVTVAGTLPWVLVGPFTGALTDRLDRRRLLWRVSVFQAVLMAAFTLLIGADATPVAVLAATTFLMTSAETLAMNASAALVPELVAKDRLAPANSLLQGGHFVTSDLAGMAVGAVLFGLGPVLPFTVDTVSFALAAVLLLGIRPPTSGGAPAGRVTVRSLLRDIRAGMRWLLAHRLLRTLCVLFALSNFAVTGVLGIAVLYALEVLGVSQTGYGLLMVVVAVGGVGGLVVAPLLTSRLGLGRTIQVSLALAPVPFLVAGLTSAPLVAAGSLLLVGAGVSIGNVASMSIRQLLVPTELFGRVNSSYRLVAQGLSPLGGVFAGLLAAWYGLHAPFLFGAALFTGIVIFGAPRVSDTAVRAAESAVQEEGR
ncbi:MFS transporter [Actinosynnema sp. NPDC047251]|uniref:Permease, MFS-type n=1 Tax=Saccharothrix espanaensis (strain ATCC 51144 / DSM 44229 / JCM 9112 / NBRC 15066 / NRRL 15764) TaxID=1179773 RepID=K0JY97_SACES|nr:MFS transporter [Saccharothrix espanaensis]CCH32925.1 Permease, MFS-type [Saccharothrix espanaensis DSM 44229]